MPQSSAPSASNRDGLVRWFFAYGTFGVPQAAGPIAFSLLVLPLTGDPQHGAAIVLAMTLTQVIAAVPIAGLGRQFNSITYLRALVAFRTLALLTLALAAAAHASLPILVCLAAMAGLVNGAAYGFMRSALNYLVDADNLPRALGIGTTLNEVTFVAAPVLASLLGSLDPVFGLVVLTLIGGTPALLVPSISGVRPEPSSQSKGQLVTPRLLFWLACATASGSTIAGVEIGAVALAMSFGFEPALGFIFTVALCVASVIGGVWVSMRNRLPARVTVIGYLVLMTVGAVLIAAGISVPFTIAGALAVGLVLAPLGTFYSLMVDKLAAPDRRAEAFALLRTANSLGVILCSAILSVTSLTVALTVNATLLVITLVSVVAFSSD